MIWSESRVGLLALLVLLLLQLCGDLLAHLAAPFPDRLFELDPDLGVAVVDDAHDVNPEDHFPSQLGCLDPVAQIVGTSIRLLCIRVKRADGAKPSE